MLIHEEKKSNKVLKNIFKRSFIWYILVVLLALSFFIGLYIGERQYLKVSQTKVGQLLNQDLEQPDYLSQDVDFQLFWDTWQIIKNEYINSDIEDPKMFYGALQGMVASLGDPYSMFFTPELAEEFTQELKGSFEGIGAEIGIKNNRLTIIAPLPDTPAEQAGIQAGDKIYGIDDMDTTSISLDYAVSKIRGEKDTEVRLLVARDGWDELKEIPIVRGTIHINSVRHETKQEKIRIFDENNSDSGNLDDNSGEQDFDSEEGSLIDGNIGYIEIIHFNEDTTSDFRKVVKEYMDNPDLQGLVLDLRNNPGGFFSSAIEIASEWIQDGIVVKEKFSEAESDQVDFLKTERDHYSIGKARLQGIPTIVLVNQGSASSSEIVAGALQDHNVALLVGEQTFGKGSVQTLKPLRGGAAIKFTVAKWLTPNGRFISEQGIAPDIEVLRTDEDYNLDRDPQLNRAIEILKSGIPFDIVKAQYEEAKRQELEELAKQEAIEDEQAKSAIKDEE